MTNSVSSHGGKWLAAIAVLVLWSGVCAFGLAIAPPRAAPITLAWDSANDPSVQGYKIYFGTINQLATNHIDAGTNLTVTLFNLQVNAGYWIYAVSYDEAGMESLPSNQLLIIPSALSPMRITRSAAGDFRLTLRAAPGAVCRVEYANAPDSTIWRTLDTATADANGDVVVIDPADPQLPLRFYRALPLVKEPGSTEPPPE